MLDFNLWLENSEIEVLKKNKRPLEDQEKDEAIKAGCVWNFGNLNKPTCAIYKSKDNQGKECYYSCTHRTYSKDFTLKKAIDNWHKIVRPSA